MNRLLIAPLLAGLLLFQLGSDAVLLQWQRVANESFTALFCVNRAMEEAPMCFGSCKADAIATDLEEKDELSGKPAGTTLLVYLGADAGARVLPETRPTGFAPIPLPATVPEWLPRGYVTKVFQPPAQW